MVKCHKCDRIILDATQSGGYKLRTRMVLFQDGKAIALCPTCKTPIEVPIALNVTEEMKAQLPKKKFVINT